MKRVSVFVATQAIRLLSRSLRQTQRLRVAMTNRVAAAALTAGSEDGQRVAAALAAAASASNHFTDQHLRPEQAVEFRGRGVVRGIHYQRASDGAWRRVHIIEAIEVELLGKPHAVA